MKKRSASTKMAKRHEPLVYFTDRDLGKRFPAALSESGLIVRPYHEVFPSDDKVADQEWIRHACDQGWVCVTHDHAIRNSEYSLGEFFRTRKVSGAMFVLRGNAAGHRLIEMFLEVQGQVERMTRKYRKAGIPFKARIVRRHSKRGVEKVHVERDMDLEIWERRNRKIFE